MIPYNPSSFNSNKTILEQILELKNWLINHPQYEVYYCNDNASLYPFVNTFSLADVSDNTNMDVGDLVVCNNAVYCKVISIDRDNGVFTAGYGVSFKGDTGAAGQQGYSLRVSSENYVDDVTAYHRNNLEPSHGTRENDTILFANGYVGIVTSLGAGATYYVTNRTVSFVGPQGPEGPQGPTGPTGADGNDGVSITNVAIDENQHLIVTLSDGNTIDAGSVSSGGIEIVEVTGTSGTISASDLTKISNGAIIWNSTYDIYYQKQRVETWFYNYVEISLGSSSLSANGMRIHKTNGSWTQSNVTLYEKTTSARIDSETATNGQVLMANGNGGASWQNAGGGSQLYRHTIHITTAISNFVFDIINNSSSQLLTYSDIRTYLYYNGYLDNGRILMCNGFINHNNTIKNAIYLYSYSATTLTIMCGTDLNLTNINVNISNAAITDKVTSL